MLKFPMVRWIALFWGFASFFPIGLNYTAFVLMSLAMLLQDGRCARFARLRQAPNWWPACFFLGWTGLILLVGPHYPETPSNAMHALRMVVTLALALALTREEAIWALRGFALGLIASLLLVALNETIGLPPNELWHSTVGYGGNKSLANALLMALATVGGWLLMPALSQRQRLVMAAITAGSLAVLVWVLHSRTAWLILAACLLVGLAHQLRRQRLRQGMALVLALSAALALATLIPDVRGRLLLGASEVAHARHGEAVQSTSSWGIRYRMYSETVDMIRAHPWLGLGMGGWSTEWRRRVDGPLAGVNMPHNDFLWMGAQAGVLGALTLLLLIAAGLPAAWRRHNKRGRMGVAALLAMLLAVATNSALRDASIGLSLWFIVLVFQRLSNEAEPVWPALLPERLHESRAGSA